MPEARVADDHELCVLLRKGPAADTRTTYASTENIKRCVCVCVPCHGSGNCALKCPRKESCDPILQVSDSQDLKHENWEGLPQQM